MRFVCLLLLVVLGGPRWAYAQETEKKKLKVVAVTDGPSPTFDRWLKAEREQTITQLSDRYVVDFPEDALEGDWTSEGANRKLEEAYADPEIDAIYGFGELVARSVALRRRLPKTTILPFVIEGELLGLPRREDSSGRANLSYISEKLDFKDPLDRLREVAGSDRIVVLTEPYQADYANELLSRQGLNERATVIAAAEPTARAMLDLIPAGTDGVVVGLIRRLDLNGRRDLLKGLIERRLPSVAMGGPSWVELGALMTLRSRTELTRRAQRAALNLDLILGGRRASELHVDFIAREELLINLAVARALGVRLGFEVLIDADVINETKTPRGEGAIALGAALEEARVNNLSLQVAGKFVEAGEEGVTASRGPLLPRGSLDAGVVQRDPDRALFLTAERQASWSARASQTIYSEGSWTDFKSTEYNQVAREYGYLTDQLDVMFSAGVAFIEVLRAAAAERIQRNNLERTREYLDLARVRMEVGVANASEVYRWQVDLAENQQQVVDARARVSQAKIELNRVLNRPSEQPINPVDLPRDAEGHPEEPKDALGPYLIDPWAFQQVRSFMVAEGLQNSPEIRDIAQQKRAEERINEGRRRQLWLPDSFVEGGVVHDFWRDGTGSEGDPALGIPAPDKFGWDVGLFLSIPLSTGGTQVSLVRQSARLVERLEAEYARIEQIIDTNVRTQLYSASAAQSGVILTRRAAEAATNNLNLVTDLYRQGTVDIITLVDAQTQSLIADLGAADAVYNYMVTLLLVDRAAGHFRVLDSEAQKRTFAQKLNAYLLAAEGGPQPVPEMR